MGFPNYQQKLNQIIGSGRTENKNKDLNKRPKRRTLYSVFLYIILRKKKKIYIYIYISLFE